MANPLHGACAFPGLKVVAKLYVGFFSIGTVEIKRICKLLNENKSFPSHAIALPFYRELPSRWNIFNELSKKVYNITINREDLFDDIFPTPGKIPRSVAPGTYRRAIIIATNIAEASITIDSHC